MAAETAYAHSLTRTLATLLVVSTSKPSATHFDWRLPSVVQHPLGGVPFAVQPDYFRTAATAFFIPSVVKVSSAKVGFRLMSRK